MFYLFHGDDDHSQKETLVSLQAKMGDPAMLDLNTTRFEGLMPFAQLQQACSAMPFLAPVRLVVVNNLFKAKPNKAFLDELTAFLPQLPDFTRLFFLESEVLPASYRLLKLAEAQSQGFVRQFSRPEGAALERWIGQRAAAQNGRLSPAAAHMLATNVGSDLRTLAHEIDKLVLYKGTEVAIETDDVLLLSPYAAEASIFDLVDALGNRNGRRASQLLQQKTDDGTDPFYLFSMFIRQFRLLIQVRELADEGLRSPEIAKALHLHSFVAGKLFQQSRGFDLAQLERIYHHLLEIDVAVKTGRADMLTSLSLLVANLTILNA